MVSKASRRDKSPAEKLQWVILLAAFAAAIGVIFFQNDKFYEDYRGYIAGIPSAPGSGNGLLTRVTIDFGNGTKRAFQGPVETSMTLLAALRAAGDAGEFTVTTDDGGRVVAIGNVRETRGRRWQAYRNGALVAELPGRVRVQAGDRLVFQYE